MPEHLRSAGPLIYEQRHDEIGHLYLLIDDWFKSSYQIMKKLKVETVCNGVLTKRLGCTLASF